MPDTRLIKPKPVATKPKHMNKKPAETTPAVRTRDASVGHRKNRASSCPRFTHDTEYKPKATERSTKAIKEKQSETLPRSKPATCAPKEQPLPKSHSHAFYETHSQKAFTVFAPNPKKRQDIQQKAEAELAALEDLRLSRAMGYISISPSTVEQRSSHRFGTTRGWMLNSGRGQGKTTARNANQEKTKAG